MDTVMESSFIGVSLGPLFKLFIPFLVCLKPAVSNFARMRKGFFIDFEGFPGIETKHLFQAGNGFRTQLGTVGRLVISLARGWPCHQGVNFDELRTVSDFLSPFKDLCDSCRIFLIGTVRLDETELVGVPAVSPVAFKDIFSEGDLAVAFDLDVVGIKDNCQVAQLLVPCQGAGF